MTKRFIGLSLNRMFSGIVFVCSFKPGSISNTASRPQKNAYNERTEERCEELGLIVVFNGDEDGVEENEDNDEPVKRLTLD